MSYHLTLALALSLSFSIRKNKGFCQPTAFGLEWKLCFLVSAARQPACKLWIRQPPNCMGQSSSFSFALAPGLPATCSGSHMTVQALIPLTQGGPDFMGQVRPGGGPGTVKANARQPCDAVFVPCSMFTSCERHPSQHQEARGSADTRTLEPWLRRPPGNTVNGEVVRCEG